MLGDLRFQNKIRFLNAVSIAWVVLMHANSLYLYPGLENLSGGAFAAFFQNFLCFNLAEMGVPLMFAISGFLFYGGLNREKLPQKLTRRARTLLVPYLIWNGLYYFAFLFLSRLGIQGLLTQSMEFSIPGLLRGILLHSMNPSGWFLMQLILFAAVSPLLLPLLDWSRGGGILLFGVLLFHFIGKPIPYLRTDALVYYLIGALAARQLPEQVILRGGRGRQLLGLLLFFCYEMGFYLSLPGGAAVPSVLLRSLLLVGVWLLADGLDFSRVKAPFSHTFFVYLAHMLPLGALRILFFRLLPNNPLGAMGSFLFPAAGAIFCCLGVARIMTRFCPGLFSILTGDRS